MKVRIIYSFFLVLAFATVFSFNTSLSDPQKQSKRWVAPPKADSLKNPLSGSTKAKEAGEKTFAKLCAICHGKQGKGDGIAGMSLNPRPADLTSENVQKQSDGAIFWKITEGKAPMAAYKKVLNEEQRWQLVNYIRKIRKPKR